MTNLSIRPASPSDVPRIYQFIRELAEYEKLLPMVSATEADIQNALFGEKPCAEALLTYWDEAPVGFALFFTTFSTFVGRPSLYLEDVYIQPQYRGKGIGKAVLAYLARLAKERGYGRFEWSVLDWNEPAIRFYKSLGAVPMEEWTIYRLTGDSLNRLGSEGENQ